MLIKASTRPIGVKLKRGTTTKALHIAMGWKKEKGLDEVCMNLELTADLSGHPRADSGFLYYMNDIFTGRGGSIVLFDIEGKEMARYGNKKEAVNGSLNVSEAGDIEIQEVESIVIPE